MDQCNLLSFETYWIEDRTKTLALAVTTGKRRMSESENKLRLRLRILEILSKGNCLQIMATMRARALARHRRVSRRPSEGKFLAIRVNKNYWSRTSADRKDDRTVGRSSDLLEHF